jgi:tetratricopeptide (TPR) repeat protein
VAFEQVFASMDLITFPLLEKASAAGLLNKEENEEIHRNAIAINTQIAMTFARDDRMQEVVAKAHRRAGYLRGLRRDPRAMQDYQRSVQIYETMAARSPSFIWLRTGLIETLREHARERAGSGDPAGADAATRRALVIAEGLVDDKDAALLCFRKGLVGPFVGLARDVADSLSARPDDTALAVRLARRAVEWEPELAAAWYTLGAASYRMGDWDAAASALARSMELTDGGGPGDWFYLAMTLRQKGQPDRARALYERAVARMREDSTRYLDLRRPRTEAAQLLGLATADGNPLGVPDR